MIRNFGMSAAAAVVVGLATSADASVYRYDVAMQLTALTLNGVTGINLDFAPDTAVDGISCSSSGEPGEPSYHYACEGSANVIENRLGIPFLDTFSPTISASLTLDTADSRSWEPSGALPICDGSALICDRLFYGFPWEASATGFTLSQSNVGWGYIITEKDLYYEDDGSYSFTVGNTGYWTGPSGGLLARYATTSLTITPELSPVPLSGPLPGSLPEPSPVPLPASLPLLGIGMAVMGLSAHRRKAARTA